MNKLVATRVTTDQLLSATTFNDFSNLINTFDQPVTICNQILNTSCPCLETNRFANEYLGRTNIPCSIDQ